MNQNSYSTLDQDINDILQISNVSQDVKWILYFRALENSLYKSHPTLKPFHFNFEVQEENGVMNIVIKTASKQKKYLKYLTFCIGPCMSIIFTTIFKKCDSCTS